MSKGVQVRVLSEVQCSGGETGRRAGLKILSFGVRVQVPLGVQKIFLQNVCRNKNYAYICSANETCTTYKYPGGESHDYAQRR